MQAAYHFDLIEQLGNFGVNVYADAGRVQVKLPWPVERTPEEARPLLRQVRERQAEILTYLQKLEPAAHTVAGKVIQLQRMRDTCQAAGHCLQLAPEQGCNLYPVRLGWCRERI